MPNEFIDRLDLAPVEKQKLHRLADAGSNTPFKLLGLHKAVPGTFSDSAARQLALLISDEQRTMLSREMPEFATGALLDLPADLKR
jgi:hypothetical protein